MPELQIIIEWKIFMTNNIRNFYGTLKIDKRSASGI